jgi:hypothetical protein
MCNEKSKNASTLSSVPTLFLTLNPEKKKEKKKGKERKKRWGSKWARFNPRIL